VDKPVVRMFVGEFGTVRWETRVKGKKGLKLEVKGPREAVTAHEFPDPLALVEYQSTAERRLLNTGYEVVATTERRTGKDRRGKGRKGRGRRKEDRESD
jgi:hypothetical protein